MQKTPKGLRTHIGIFGRTNAGKSTLLNAVTSQDVALVSDVPGTTTDPVEKAMELLPLGPVLFIDTAGINDMTVLGKKRLEKTKKVFDRTDIAIVVTDSCREDDFEKKLIKEFKQRNIPVFVVCNKKDIAPPQEEFVKYLESENIPWIAISALCKEDIALLKERFINALPETFFTPDTIVGDLIKPGDMVVLVVPIDLEAPKGRLIMPQVQTIRDILDNDAYCSVVKERELRDLLMNLKKPPALVITDSQAFLKVVADTPDSVPLTSFSILFARYKGDLETFTEGAKAIDNLKPGDKILIAEACTHHPIAEDIGRVKIPRWITQYVGGKLNFTFCQGLDFPEDLNSYKLVIHCGGCTLNRKALMTRIIQCRNAKVPITNYGVTIAFTLGVFERALSPFKFIYNPNPSGENGRLQPYPDTIRDSRAPFLRSPDTQK